MFYKPHTDVWRASVRIVKLHQLTVKPAILFLEQLIKSHFKQVL